MPRLDLVALTVESIDASIAFYRLLGIDVPEPDGGPHHEATLPNGLRFAWDTVALIKEIDPSWTEPKGQRTGLAFLCDDASEVDRVYAEIVAKGYAGHKEPWNAFWG